MATGSAAPAGVAGHDRPADGPVRRASGSWSAVGLAIIGYAGNVAWRGWTEKFAEHLETEGKLGYSGAATSSSARSATSPRAVALAIVGGLFCYAGITHEPSKSGGLDAALQKVLEQPFGPYLLIAIGVGIACYGLFCFARARHLDR